MEGRKWHKHFTRLHHCCSLSQRVVKALDSRCTVETLRWGLALWTHMPTQTLGYTVVNLAQLILLQEESLYGRFREMPEL